MSDRGLTFTLALAGVLGFALSLNVGSVDIGFADVLRSLAGTADNAESRIVIELRLPRTITGFIVGGLLALAGALLQVLLRNPLADPYVLGISGGAAVATLLAMLAGAGTAYLAGSAFAGSLVSMLLVFALSHSGGAHASLRLLLTGVVMAAGWGALISLILVMSPDRQIHGMLFWLMGDLSQTGNLFIGGGVLVAGGLLAWTLARPLNLFARGELVAAALGENPIQLRNTIYFLASLLTATAVTLAGSIGFVGLVVPHMLRLSGVTNHKWLLPQCILLGGTFLMLADAVARSILAPQQLPVGVITALAGVPLFLYLLMRSSHR